MKQLTESRLRSIIREEIIKEGAISPRMLAAKITEGQVVAAAKVDSHEIILTMADGGEISIRAENDGIVGYTR